MLPDVADAGMAAAAAEKIRARLGKPEFIDGYEIRLTASIGAALYPADGKSLEQLTKHADDAMYRAKAGSCRASIKALPARNPVDATPAVGDGEKVRSIASGR